MDLAMFLSITRIFGSSRSTTRPAQHDLADLQDDELRHGLRLSSFLTRSLKRLTSALRVRLTSTRSIGDQAMGPQ
eukprot:2359018-Amphidinium_carterae.1